MKVFLTTFIFSLVLTLSVNEVKGQCGTGCTDGTVTVTANGTGITVNSGKTMCLIVDGNYSLGTITVQQGGVVNICTTLPSYTVTIPDASWNLRQTGGKNWSNGGAVTMNINCNVSSDVVSLGDCAIINVSSSGSLTLNPAAGANFAMNGKIINAGTITGNFTGAGFMNLFALDNTGTIKNNTTSIKFNAAVTNSGTIWAKQDITLNGGSSVINNGSVSSDRDFTSSTGSTFSNFNYWYAKRNAGFAGTYNNSALFQADGKISLNNGGLLNFVNSGIFDVDSLILNSGTLQTNATCAVFRVKHYSSISSSLTLTGVSGSVAILDQNNPGIIDNVVCSCNGIDHDFIDNGVSPPDPAGTCSGKPSGGANTIAAGPYCGIVPISSLSGGPSGCFATLPVVWQSISAKRISATNNIINWTVEEDGDNVMYEVEYSLDGSIFEQAGLVKPNSVKTEVTYSFTHENHSAGAIYYRVKQIDKDGRYSYSSIVEASGNITYYVFVSPNPGTDLVTLTSVEEIKTVEVFASDGSLITTYNLNGDSVIDVSKLRNGVYFMKSCTVNGNCFTKFIKQ